MFWGQGGAQGLRERGSSSPTGPGARNGLGAGPLPQLNGEREQAPGVLRMGVPGRGNSQSQGCVVGAEAGNADSSG